MYLPQFMQPFISAIILSLLSFNVESQIESLFTTNGILSGEVVLNTQRKLRFATRNGWNTNIYQFDVTTGIVDSTSVDNYPLREVQFTDDKMFYITFDYINGNDGMHTLNVLDTSGNLMVPVDINEYFYLNSSKYHPKYGTICNQRYYVNGFFNNTHCLWESDGTSVGTHTVFESSDRIIAVNTLNDTIFIATDDGTNYQLHYYALNQPIQTYAIISKANITYYFSSQGNSDSHFYFNGKNDSNEQRIYRCDFSAPPEEFMPGWARNITFQADSFLLRGSLDFNSSKLYRGSVNDPLSASEIEFKQAISSPSIRVDMHYGGKFYRTRSIENGIELVRISDEDSLELIQTNAYGAKSGILIREEGYVEDQYLLPPKFFTDNNDVSYGILTNGLDSYYYMYRLDGNNEQCLFRMDNPEGVLSIFTYNNFVYWLEELEGQLSIKRRSLLLPNEEQTEQSNNPEGWFRQFGVSYQSDVIYGYDLRPNLKGVQLDTDGNAYFGFIINDYATGINCVSSDTNELLDFLGSNIFVKYNSEGEFQWANGIGERHGLFFNEGEFALKPNGNVVVLGHFFQNAYFDQDTLTIPRSGFFIAELDANSGNVLWKNIFAEMFYGNDILLDRIETDEDGNIYVAFMYKNFTVDVDGISLNSIKSPANALAKFDPNGNVIWAQTIETPWLDFYGRTRSMDYSSEFQTLTVVQSMGSYNVSSSCAYHDWGYYIQEFDKEGNLLNKHELGSSDLGSLTVGTRTSKNQFFGKGYFRGTLSFDQFETTTNSENGCNRNEGFGLIYDSHQNEVISTTATENAAFFPFDIAKTNEAIYVYGVDEENELTLLKYTLDGSKIAYKKLRQYSSPFDWLGQRNYFDITEDHILIVGSNFRRNPEMDIIPLMNAIPSISILKIENNEWADTDDWMDQIAIELPIESNFMVYPNPFSDYIKLLFAGTEVIYTHYQIVDAMGRIVQTDNLNELQLQTIQVENLSAGIYTITVFNDSEKLSQQLVKF